MFVKKMKTIGIITVAAVLMLGGMTWIGYQTFANNPTDVGATKPGIALPADPKAVVIALDYKGGFTPPRKSNEPHLAIRADGTVILGDPFGMTKKVEAKLAPAELQELLRFVITEQDFFGYDPAKVRQAIGKNGRPLIAIADAATTMIRIKTAAKEHQASHYALSFAVNQHKNVKQLAQLHAIEKRLQRLMHEIRAGGKAGVAAALKLANQHLKQKYPQAVPLKAENLASAYIRANGQKYVAFSRVGEKKGTYISVNILTPAGGQPKVTVNAKLK